MEQLGSDDFHVNNNLAETVKEALAKLDILDTHMQLFEQELSSDGLFSEYLEKSLNNEMLGDISTLLKEIMVLFNVTQISSHLESIFGEVELVFFSADLVTLKFQNKGERSIGYLTGQVQKMEEQCSIKDFEAKQTTLEQIFNNFAAGGKRKMTLVGKKNPRILNETSFS